MLCYLRSNPSILDLLILQKGALNARCWNIHGRGKLVNSKTSKRLLPTPMPDNTSDAPFFTFTLRRKQSSEFYLHSLNAVEVILMQEKVSLMDSIPTVEDLHKSSHQHDLTGRPLLHYQNQFTELRESQLRQAILILKKI